MAVERSIGWAQQDALEWLAMVESMDGDLPSDAARLRHEWREALLDQRRSYSPDR